MNVTAIIAEYNPFHNGHRYQLERAREETGADYLLVVMSGPFTQRGLPAITDKYTRARMALENGADLVLELPVCYACGSAFYFAQGAAALLDKLGVVNALCFGSESGNLALLKRAAALLVEEPEDFRAHLQALLKSGLSYPAARTEALCRRLSCPPGNGTSEPASHGLTTEFLSSPNNLLGIEYCRALLARRSAIRPHTIKRVGSGYKEASLQPAFSSAQAIRSALLSPASGNERARLDSACSQLPSSSLRLLQEQWGRTAPLPADAFSLPLHYRLLQHAKEGPEGIGYDAFFDVSGELSDRIRRMLPDYQDFSSFCDALKTRELTHSRISRSLLHILLGLREETVTQWRSRDWIFYARPLGFRESAAPLLSAVREKSSIPFLARLADSFRQLEQEAAIPEAAPEPALALAQLKSDIHAAHLYNLLIHDTFRITLPGEYQRRMLRL